MSEVLCANPFSVQDGTVPLLGVEVISPQRQRRSLSKIDTWGQKEVRRATRKSSIYGMLLSVWQQVHTCAANVTLCSVWQRQLVIPPAC